MSKALRCAPALAVLPVLLLLPGCTDTLDTEKGEKEIKRQLANDTGAKRVNVKCPEDVSAKKGNDFACKASADGEKFKVVVTQTNDDGDVQYEIVER